jgi:hypothetical protein
MYMVHTEETDADYLHLAPWRRGHGGLIEAACIVAELCGGDGGEIVSVDSRAPER